jgi:hypothetical protein
MPVTPTRTTALAVTAAFLAAGLSACETTGPAPPDSHLNGSWRLDKSASDDPDATITKVMSTAQTRLRHRLAHYGYGPPDQPPPGAGGPDTGPDAPDYSFDTPGDRYGGPGLVGPDFRGLRVRLREALVPPAMLHLAVQDDIVSIGADQLPPRDYRVGEKLSRIDDYGTAIITPTFLREEFVLKSNYTTRALRIETYEVNPSSGALTVTEQLSDPTVGKIVLHSVYRRG